MNSQDSLLVRSDWLLAVQTVGASDFRNSPTASPLFLVPMTIDNQSGSIQVVGIEGGESRRKLVDCYQIKLLDLGSLIVVCH